MKLLLGLHSAEKAHDATLNNEK